MNILANPIEKYIWPSEHLCLKNKKTELEENYYILEENTLQKIHRKHNRHWHWSQKENKYVCYQYSIDIVGFDHFKKIRKLKSYKNINGENKTGHMPNFWAHDCLIIKKQRQSKVIFLEIISVAKNSISDLRL